MLGREAEEEGAGAGAAGGTATREGGIKRVVRPSAKNREGKKIPDTSQLRAKRYRENKAVQARGGVTSPQQVTAGVSTAAAGASTESISTPTTAGESSASAPQPVTMPVEVTPGAPVATTDRMFLASGDETSRGSTSTPESPATSRAGEAASEGTAKARQEYVSPLNFFWNGSDCMPLYPRGLGRSHGRAVGEIWDCTCLY